MQTFLMRNPKGGMAIVSADDEMEAKLDLLNHCYGVELDEVTSTEMPLQSTGPCVVEIHSFKNGEATL